MPSDVGLSLDERIRRSLEPLGGPLRIDAFLDLARRERARLAAEKAKRSAPAAQAQEPPPRRAVPPARSAAEPRAAATAEGYLPTDLAGELADSGRIRAEVQAFLKRDEVEGTTSSEVSDFMDFLGGGLQPDDPDPAAGR